MTKPFVAILLGSESDFPVMQTTTEILSSLGIAFELKVTSAHRTPDRTNFYVMDAENRGCQVFICAAGLAAHLAGCVAAHTIKPVIGVPMDAGGLHGMDALLSTVQMPGGVPVACVAIGKPGAQNAAYLSAQILAISNPAISLKLQAHRQEVAKQMTQKDEMLQAKLNEQIPVK